jgi:hypothetical protein
MLVQAASERMMGRTEQAIKALLLERHRIPLEADPDFRSAT